MLANSKGEAAQKEEAQAVAVAALGFIAADEDRLGHFLDLTGLAPDDIRRAVSQAGFLASVLQHVMSDEATAAAFATENHLSPEALRRAAHRLGVYQD
ncbi:DUF3572 family protein [Labrys monachus]|uniref:DUF3572 family protein n=1 Tax=Labrys monachus TaxID=217067 RepID=A0ABU0FEM8_9HYPH|nr:DUF3572 family protein [Labrys monachus]MDQ0393069.1 hypothetical protein [Labrys monachus]